MELRQLRYFAAVADELHFGRAAQRLHMSQPPLSLQVSRLEEELGVRLLTRTTRHVSLTAAGRRFRDRVRDILAEIDEAAGELRAYADGFAGALAVGFVSSANYTVLPGVARLFRERRPGVELTLVPLTSGEQRERLAAGALDVGIVRDEAPPSAGVRMSAEVVFEERLVACLPGDHPLAALAEVTSEQIGSLPMISYPRSLMPGYVDRVAGILGDAARTVEEVVHQETALGFVAAGAGASVLPESVRQLVPPSIAVVPIAGSPTTRLLAVRRDDAERAVLARAFVSCLHEAAAGLVTSRGLRVA